MSHKSAVVAALWRALLEAKFQLARVEEILRKEGLLEATPPGDLTAGDAFGEDCGVQPPPEGGQERSDVPPPSFTRKTPKGDRG